MAEIIIDSGAGPVGAMHARTNGLTNLNTPRTNGGGFQSQAGEQLGHWPPQELGEDWRDSSPSKPSADDLPTDDVHKKLLAVRAGMDVHFTYGITCRHCHSALEPSARIVGHDAQRNWQSRGERRPQPI